MEFTQENHYSQILLQSNMTPSLDYKNLKRSNLTATGKIGNPIQITFKEKECWILDSELELLKSNFINLDDIEVMVYNEGMYSPFNKKRGTMASSIDGYQIHIIHHIQSSDMILVEFRSVYDHIKECYHRLGDKEQKLETDRYSKTTTRDLASLNLREKSDLVERANKLLTILTFNSPDYQYL